MNRAKQYHLNFTVVNLENYLPEPLIISDKNLDGTMISDPDFIKFLHGGAKYSQPIIDEINNWIITDDIPYTLEQDYPVTVEGNNETQAIILNSPPRLRFAHNFEIPITHVIEILQEWIAFLQTIKYKNYFTGK